MNIRLEHLQFSYSSRAFPPHRVFHDLCLSIVSGETVAVTGEEGTGKSTLLQLMAGLQKPDAGRVLIDGRDIWLDPRQQHRFRRNMGYVFQFPEQQFFCETVRDELLYASRNFGLIEGDLEERCAVVLEGLGAEMDLLDRSPFSLSMGEARRVALASVLVHQPDVFLMDEPTAGLDGFGIEAVRSLLLGLRARGKTILLVSHESDIVGTVATRVIVLGNETVFQDTMLPGLNGPATEA